MRKKAVKTMSVEHGALLLKQLLPFLLGGRFVNVATCSQERMPNTAPKIIAKVDKNVIYLVDHVIGTTYANLKENPRVSLGLVDEKNLTGYQLNGTATVMERGRDFEVLAEEFQKIKTDFTVQRILYNVRSGRQAPPVELALPERFAIIKIHVIEVVEIATSGDLKARFAL
ncbi:MAG: pyridoxamine 5'-phosphate oxidase family protein [Deltaproteobacteria bacterium]